MFVSRPQSQFFKELLHALLNGFVQYLCTRGLNHIIMSNSMHPLKKPLPHKKTLASRFISWKQTNGHENAKLLPVMGRHSTSAFLATKCSHIHDSYGQNVVT